MPRIRVWKGDLITHFSNMVLARTGPAHPLKDISNTCYASSTFEDCNLKDAIKLAVGYSLSDKVKEEVCDCFQRHLLSEGNHTRSKAASVLLDVLKCIVATNSQSGSTEKIECLDGDKILLRGKVLVALKSCRRRKVMKKSKNKVSLLGGAGRSRPQAGARSGPAAAARGVGVGRRRHRSWGGCWPPPPLAATAPAVLAAAAHVGSTCVSIPPWSCPRSSEATH